MTRSSALTKLVMLTLAAVPLAACGGGGGGSGPAFIPAPPPPPPVAPPPSPPPPPPVWTVSAPARATMPAIAPIYATAGGANFDTGTTAGTVFPLLETVVWQNGQNLVSDTDLNLAQTGTVQNGQFKATDGTTTTIADASLDWTRTGFWDVPTDWYATPNMWGAFVAGYETPAGNMPASGSAVFTGVANGLVFTREGLQVLSGGASLTADFGGRTVSGALTGMTAGGVPWNDVAFVSTISGNAFSGSTSVTSAPVGTFSLGLGATGTLEGRFFGPAAQEAGGVWTLFDGVGGAIGTLSGRRP